MSYAPQDIATEIQKSLPSFTIAYAVDPGHQAIADSWTRSMDDTVARLEWGWSPHCDLAVMTKEMLVNLVVQGASQRETTHDIA